MPSPHPIKADQAHALVVGSAGSGKTERTQQVQQEAGNIKDYNASVVDEYKRLVREGIDTPANIEAFMDVTGLAEEDLAVIREGIQSPSARTPNQSTYTPPAPKSLETIAQGKNR